MRPEESTTSADGSTAQLTVDNTTIVGNTAQGAGCRRDPSTAAVHRRAPSRSRTRRSPPTTAAPAQRRRPLAGQREHDLGTEHRSWPRTRSSSQAQPPIAPVQRHYHLARPQPRDRVDCGFTATGDLQNTDPKFTRRGERQRWQHRHARTRRDEPCRRRVRRTPRAAPALTSATCPGRRARLRHRCVRELAARRGPAILGGDPLDRLAVIAGTINWGDGSSAGPRSRPRGDQRNTHLRRGPTTALHGSTATEALPSRIPGQGRGRSTIRHADLRTRDRGYLFTGPVATSPTATRSPPPSTTPRRSTGAMVRRSTGTVSGRARGSRSAARTPTPASGPSRRRSRSPTRGGATQSRTARPRRARPRRSSTGAAVGRRHYGRVHRLGRSGWTSDDRLFQYGLDPKYIGGGPVVYTQSTPAQSVGSDFASHTVSASVTGLVPNALYHVRLVATNSAGTTFGPDVTSPRQDAAARIADTRQDVQHLAGQRASC